MSTRATYRFENGDTSRRSCANGMSHPAVTFYIHHDGYPQGAAVYLWNMHHCEQHDGSPAGKFYRANDRAEFTDGHNAHGDTEYRYTLRGSMLSAWKRYLGQGDNENWHPFYAGEYHEFVTQHGRDFIEDYSPLRAVPTVYGWRSNETRVYSRKQILAGLIKAREEHASYVERFPTYSGNISGLAETIAAWERALAAYNAQDAAPATANG